jgi:hypothetical protein
MENYLRFLFNDHFSIHSSLSFPRVVRRVAWWTLGRVKNAVASASCSLQCALVVVIDKGPDGVPMMHPHSFSWRCLGACCVCVDFVCTFLC